MAAGVWLGFIFIYLFYTDVKIHLTLQSDFKVKIINFSLLCSSPLLLIF